MTKQQLAEIRERYDDANHDCECGECEWCMEKYSLENDFMEILPKLLDEIERLQHALDAWTAKLC